MVLMVLHTVLISDLTSVAQLSGCLPVLVQQQGLQLYWSCCQRLHLRHAIRMQQHAAAGSHLSDADDALPAASEW